MGTKCCGSDNVESTNTKYRIVLWICLMANGLMFVVQTAASYHALSVSLLANALDFFSDAANYGISLFVLSKSLKAKVTASMIKGVSLGLIGLWVAFETFRHALYPWLPKPETMFLISLIGLVVNVLCAVLLYKFRGGDVNRQSVWICSRNDAIGNIAVMAAAAGVFATVTAWPDIIVAAILGFLAISGSWSIISSARNEMKNQS